MTMQTMINLPHVGKEREEFLLLIYIKITSGALFTGYKFCIACKSIQSVSVPNLKLFGPIIYKYINLKLTANFQNGVIYVV